MLAEGRGFEQDFESLLSKTAPGKPGRHEAVASRPSTALRTSRTSKNGDLLRLEIF
jgi:hypothetical protein